MMGKSPVYSLLDELLWYGKSETPILSVTGVQEAKVTTGFSFKPLWLRLEVAQKRLIDELEQLKTDSRPVAETPGTWAKEDEHANLISESQKRRALEKLLRDQLAEIEHALRRKDQGTYGLCDNCGQPIDLGRLEALPQANLCLNCKARQAKNASDSINKRRKEV